MRKQFAALVAALSLSAAAAVCLPGVLGLPPGAVEERLMAALLPLFMAFLWWAW